MVFVRWGPGGVVWASPSSGAVSSPRRHPGAGTDYADTKERDRKAEEGRNRKTRKSLPGSLHCSQKAPYRNGRKPKRERNPDESDTQEEHANPCKENS